MRVCDIAAEKLPQLLIKPSTQNKNRISQSIILLFWENVRSKLGLATHLRGIFIRRCVRAIWIFRIQARFLLITCRDSSLQNTSIFTNTATEIPHIEFFVRICTLTLFIISSNVFNGKFVPPDDLTYCNKYWGFKFVHFNWNGRSL